MAAAAQSQQPSLPKRMSLDVSADVTSCESLSFTGLVCIQNQHLMPQTGYTHPLPPARKASQEFEFSHATPASTTAFRRNNYSAEKMSSNGHLQPHAIPFCSNQSRVVEQTSSKRLMPSALSKNSKSEITESTLEKCTRKPNTKERNRTDQKRTSAGQGFGQRIFKSFATPCKDCHAIEPTPSMRERQLQ